MNIKRIEIDENGVEVTDLTEEDSLKLQQQGIGGKHKMMCGVFVPSWNNQDR